MPRVARGKKTTENNKLGAKKVDNNEVTPKDQEVPEKLSVQDDEIEESVLNGNAEAKTIVKATKSARGKKESKNGTEKLEPKTQVTSNDDEIDVKEVPQVTKNKKRATKKKNDDIPKEVSAARKRNKVELSPNAKTKEQSKIDTSESPKNKKEAPKKRGTKELPKSDASEPAKKRSKIADEEKPAVPEEKKKIVRGRKAIEEPIIDNSESEKPAAKKPRRKAAAPTKKDEKIIDEPKVDDLVVEKAATKGKSVKKTVNKGKATDKSDCTEHVEPKNSKDEENLDEVIEDPKPTSKRAKNAINKAEKPAPEKKFQNSIESDLSIDFNIKEKWNLKIVTWNTSGLRSCVDKGCVDYFKQESPDVICLNEIKCGKEEEIPEKMKLEGYHAYWNIAKGMPGVGVLTRQFPEEVFYDLPGQFSDEKRLITVEFKKYYLVCCYVVNAGRGLKTLDKRLEWNQVFDNYIKELDKKKPVIIAGDMNVAHSEIDLANPKTNQKNAGFTKEEREGFTQLLSYGFVDTFRKLHPDEKAYTFWSYMNNARAKNVGWRLDYFITSERFVEKVKDNVIRSTIKGSDHCPLVLFLDL